VKTVRMQARGFSSWGSIGRITAPDWKGEIGQMTRVRCPLVCAADQPIDSAVRRIIRQGPADAQHHVLAAPAHRKRDFS